MSIKTKSAAEFSQMVTNVIPTDWSARSSRTDAIIDDVDPSGMSKEEIKQTLRDIISVADNCSNFIISVPLFSELPEYTVDDVDCEEKSITSDHLETEESEIIEDLLDVPKEQIDSSPFVQAVEEMDDDVVFMNAYVKNPDRSNSKPPYQVKCYVLLLTRRAAGSPYN